MKVSIGQDSHRFDFEDKNKKLILGGVEFIGPALMGNSDADVVLHAITNAISGITCVNILGKVADEMCKKGIDNSQEYVKKALEYLKEKIVHISISIEAKEPKISPKIEEMRKSISKILGITPNQVGITATSGEELTKFRRRTRNKRIYNFDSRIRSIIVEKQVQVYKKARAKINLTLDVLDKRPDNYHNIESVFQKISLYDEIYVAKTNEHDWIKININIGNLKEEENIIFQAYKLLRNNFKNIGGVNVTLKKNIPMQAGLGGGSADCGAFLECINSLFELNLTKEKLNEIGMTLGADVPASLYNKPLIAKGIGQKIQEINSNAKFYIIVIKPEFSGNTKKMYEALDNKSTIVRKNNIKEMKEAIEKADIIKISNNLYNVFESVLENVEDIKKDILEAGAMSSLMAGSGSAFFGIFENKDKAKTGYEILSKKYQTFYCLSYVK